VVQVIGALMATHAGNPWTPLFTKQMEIEKIEALQCNHFNFDANFVGKINNLGYYSYIISNRPTCTNSS
jgi:hypothetical protein